MKSVQSKDGTPIAYTKTGKGRSLLLVHGTLAEHTVWSAVVPALGKKFTVHAMERRGRGASGDASPYAIAREAEDIAACVEDIGGQVDVVAHSYGAVCALQATLLTKNIRRLVAYEPLIRTGPVERGPSPDLDLVQRLVDESNREGALRAFFKDVFRTPEQQIEKISAQPYWVERLSVIQTAPREVGASRNYRFESTLFSGMNVPTLLMLGGDSPAHFKAATDLLRDGLPRTETTVLPGQQHNAMAVAPDLFVAEIIKFLG